MKIKVCKKHELKPALIYGQCVGCEIEDLWTQIQIKEDALNAAFMLITELEKRLEAGEADGYDTQQQLTLKEIL